MSDIKKTAPRFNPEGSRISAKPLNLSELAPKQESEPTISQGRDLTGVPKVVMAVGRGKTGKTTLLRWMAEMSERGGNAPLLADIDPSNASFGQYFENVYRPQTDSPAGVATWLQKFLEHCVASKQSAIIDLGGGDTTLRSLATELPGIAGQMEAEGVAPVLLHLLGTSPEDLTPAATLMQRGFSPSAQAMVFNEYASEAGSTRLEAFGRIIESEFGITLAEKSIEVWMPKLHAAEAVESRLCLFTEARDGNVEPKLGMFDAARVRAWLEAMERRFTGIRSWIP